MKWTVWGQENQAILHRLLARDDEGLTHSLPLCWKSSLPARGVLKLTNPFIGKRKSEKTRRD